MHCPYCGSRDIDAHHYNSKIIYICNQCGVRWEVKITKSKQTEMQNFKKTE